MWPLFSWWRRRDSTVVCGLRARERGPQGDERQRRSVAGGVVGARRQAQGAGGWEVGGGRREGGKETAGVVNAERETAATEPFLFVLCIFHRMDGKRRGGEESESESWDLEGGMDWRFCCLNWPTGSARMGRGAVGSCKRRGTEGTWKRSFERHGGWGGAHSTLAASSSGRPARPPAINGDGDGRYLLAPAGRYLLSPAGPPSQLTIPSQHFPLRTAGAFNRCPHEKIAHRFFTWHKARDPAVLGWDSHWGPRGPVYTVKYTRPRTGTSPRLPGGQAGGLAGHRNKEVTASQPPRRARPLSVAR